ncbi:mitochondrial ribosome small subunit component RPS19, partial [Armillaria borealis]
PPLSLFKGRSTWKGPYFVSFSNLKEASQRNVAIKTQARACTILPNFVGIRFLVHNGKQYLPVLVTQDMVGHKLGEFSHTRKNNPTK